MTEENHTPHIPATPISVIQQTIIVNLGTACRTPRFYFGALAGAAALFVVMISIIYFTFGMQINSGGPDALLYVNLAGISITAGILSRALGGNAMQTNPFRMGIAAGICLAAVLDVMVLLIVPSSQ